MKRIAVLGSTGSIGQSALEVIRHFPDKFRVVALSANSNIDLLYKQIKLFHPELVCLTDRRAGLDLKHRLGLKPKVFTGEDGLGELCGFKYIDKAILAISGSSALSPLLALIDNGKDIALANKEALVMGGSIIMRKAAKKKVRILPVDSEQSAIWQCLEGRDSRELKNIYLTASGGPFRQMLKKDLNNVSISRVLKHPRWKMGRKISVDSATLMNKGLEILEAMSLFKLDAAKIKIVIHPEAIIHSMVEFMDGVILAQLSTTDMHIPIQYALSYPVRLTNSSPSIDFYKLRRLNFQKPDFRKFPCLELAYQAAEKLGTMPCVLNAANEVSVEEFLKGRLKFLSIPKIIENVLARHRNKTAPNLADIRQADSWAREEAHRFIDKLN